MMLHIHFFFPSLTSRTGAEEEPILYHQLESYQDERQAKNYSFEFGMLANIINFSVTKKKVYNV